jgi:hypothetical protein
MDILADLLKDIQMTISKILLLALQVYVFAKFRVEPPTDLLANPQMDLPWVHTLMEGYFMVVHLQWAHGQDILGNHGCQLNI